MPSSVDVISNTLHRMVDTVAASHPIDTMADAWIIFQSKRNKLERLIEANLSEITYPISDSLPYEDLCRAQSSVVQLRADLRALEAQGPRKLVRRRFLGRVPLWQEAQPLRQI